MRHIALLFVSLVLLLFAGVTTVAQEGQESPLSQATHDSLREPRIGIAQVFGGVEDPRLAAVAASLTNTVELNLRLLDRYDVIRVQAPDLAPDDMTGHHEWATATASEELLDYVLFGTVESIGFGIIIELSIYDRAEDALTVDATEEVTSIFNLFDAADMVTTNLLEAFSGEILVFGTIVLQPQQAAVFHVYVDGTFVGDNITEQRVLAGSRLVEIRQNRMLETVTVFRESVQIVEAERRAVSFAIPHLLPTEAVAIEELEHTINEFWDFPNEQPRVDAAFDELERLLAEPSYQPRLLEEAERFAELRAEYNTHVAAGFPFDPDRVGFVPSLARLEQNYGYRMPNSFSQELRSGAPLFRGASPWKLELGAGYSFVVRYGVVEEYAALFDDHESSGFRARLRLEYGRPQSLFHLFSEGEYLTMGEAIQRVDGPENTYTEINDSTNAALINIGIGVGRELVNRITPYAELGAGGIIADRRVLISDQDGAVFYDEFTGTAFHAFARAGLHYQLTPRLGVRAAFEYSMIGLQTPSYTANAGLVVGLGRAHRRYPRFSDNGTERHAESLRRAAYAFQPPAAEEEPPRAIVAAGELLGLYAAAGERTTTERIYREQLAGTMVEKGALLALADLAYQDNRFAEAYAAYEAAFAAADDRTDHFAEAGMARTAFEIGDTETAREHFFRLRALEPELAAEFSYVVRYSPDDPDPELAVFRSVVLDPTLLYGNEEHE